MDLALYKIAVSSVLDREQSFASSHHNGPTKPSTLLQNLEPDLSSRVNRAMATTLAPASAPTGPPDMDHQKEPAPSDQSSLDFQSSTFATNAPLDMEDSLLWDQDLSTIFDGEFDFGDEHWATLADALDLPSVRFDNSPMQSL
ncbi:hypothetical protein KVT40_005773 [Elsinoe batatas]|uniref:Uncharacterized protein n=1 Tax=Elsinoe batatas TaxID=2601811 RepID=A0A8K0L6W0_9PEZI|nr:hypothetical protein KVT40_005773 [Elsinoe batatas]